MDSLEPEQWSRAAAFALETLSTYTPAQPGDRTLMDALHPFVKSLPDGLEAAVKACQVGAESTKGMKAKLGRSVYVGEAGERWRDTPDPGAWGVLAVASGLAGQGSVNS
jgi:dihydroxyacetone kinase